MASRSSGWTCCGRDWKRLRQQLAAAVKQNDDAQDVLRFRSEIEAAEA